MEIIKGAPLSSAMPKAIRTGLQPHSTVAVIMAYSALTVPFRHQKYCLAKITNYTNLSCTPCGEDAVGRITSCKTGIDSWNALRSFYRPSGLSSSEIAVAGRISENSPGQFSTIEAYVNNFREDCRFLRAENTTMESYWISLLLYKVGALPQYEGWTTCVTEALRNDKNAYTLEKLAGSLIDVSQIKESN